MKEKLLSYIDSNKNNIIETFLYLHSIPEVGFSEVKTSLYLSECLKKFGYKVKTGVAGTGVIGILNTGIQGPCVGIRGDMDALLHEIEGKYVPFHSCGHDANCTTVLSVAEALAKTKALRKGQLRVIFQPAEEIFEGAKKMLESGEMKGLEYLIGSHLRPKEELCYGKVSPSVRHGASEVMLVEVYGMAAHAARPHQGINAIEVCCSIISAANCIHLDPQIPFSLKATMINSGGAAYNVIPGRAKIAFDMRAQTNEAMADLKKAIINVVEKGAQSCGAKAGYKFKGGVPAAKDDIDVINIANNAIKYVMGEKGEADFVVTSGGEDFHEYSYAMRNLKTTILGIGADLSPGLHKFDMTFEKDAIIYASKIMALMVHEILG